MDSSTIILNEKTRALLKQFEDKYELLGFVLNALTYLTLCPELPDDLANKADRALSILMEEEKEVSVPQKPKAKANNIKQVLPIEVNVPDDAVLMLGTEIGELLNLPIRSLGLSSTKWEQTGVREYNTPEGNILLVYKSDQSRRVNKNPACILYYTWYSSQPEAVPTP